MSKKPIIKKKEKNQEIDLNLALKISDQVELKDVRLLSSECQHAPSIIQGEKIFDIDRTIRVEIDKEKNVIFVFPKFKLKAYSERDKEQDRPFLNIEAMFVLVYQAKDLSGLNEKAFESFGQANGVYNAWPYWREYVQNITSRMGLSSLTIPVFRIVAPKKPKKTKKKVAKKKASSKKKTA